MEPAVRVELTMDLRLLLTKQAQSTTMERRPKVGVTNFGSTGIQPERKCMLLVLVC